MSKKIESVQIDALVVLKIIKHCKESLPELVTGHLLGLANENSIEITNCFPIPLKSDNDDEEKEKGSYQIEMMRAFRDVNIDHNDVGWYSSTYLGAFINKYTIETQFTYQQRLKDCVMLVFDPLQTTQGSLSLKAYRLSDWFMSFYPQSLGQNGVQLGAWLTEQQNQSNQGNPNANANVNLLRVFVEVPVSVADHQKYSLTGGLITQLTENATQQHISSNNNNNNNNATASVTVATSAQKPNTNSNTNTNSNSNSNVSSVSSVSGGVDVVVGDVLSVGYERVSWSAAATVFVERSVDALCMHIDDLCSEQTKYHNYQKNIQRHNAATNSWLQKRRLENANRKLRGEQPLPETPGPDVKLPPMPTEPSKLEALLLASQINNFCTEINQFSKNSITKLYLTNNYQKK